MAFPRARSLARRSALARIPRGERRAEAAHLALVTLLTLGFLGYLIVAWRIDPAASCACAF